MLSRRCPRGPAALVPLALAVAVGCSEQEQTPTGLLPDFSRQRAVPSTIDDHFAAIADLAPGFAGMYLENGELIVRSTRTGVEASLREAIRTVNSVARVRRVTEAEQRGAIRFIGAEYDFRSLLTWKRQLRTAIATSQVVAFDADEVANRVRIRVPDETLAEAFSTRAEQLGIPAKAVVTEIGTTRAAKDLDDKFRPVPGGVKISPGSCTMTVNAETDDGIGFITAAHCTDEFADDSDSTEFHQPNDPRFGSNRIGQEYFDPDWLDEGWQRCDTLFLGDTLPVDYCRYSDAAFQLYDDSTDAQIGEIARTIHWSGSKEIYWLIPTFYIEDAEYGTLAAGDTVYKVGYKTGWTRGIVDRTCVDYYGWEGYGTWLLCQTEATVYMDFGDSGSPVFAWDGSEYVDLWGILVAIIDSAGQWVRSGFSQWKYVDFEVGDPLGGLTVHYPD